MSNEIYLRQSLVEGSFHLNNLGECNDFIKKRQKWMNYKVKSCLSFADGRWWDLMHNIQQGYLKL